MIDEIAALLVDARAAIERVIAYELVAGRTQDTSDIEAVVRTLDGAGVAIDWAYVERWCDAWELGDALAQIRTRLAPRRPA
ncbi:MAG: hypothetical protein KF729_00705 [Sandaracinaceae bacterium]|nr:hypothetical protein [Sandaracinaceae bacterium]